MLFLTRGEYPTYTCSPRGWGVFTKNVFLMPRVPGVELRQSGSGDPLQHFFGEDSQQLPADVQRLENGAVLVVTLERKVENDLNNEVRIGH